MNDKLRQIIADATGAGLDTVGPDAAMGTLAEWDSIAHLNIVMTVEQAFGVKFSAEETLELNSIPALVAALRKRGLQ